MEQSYGIIQMIDSYTSQIERYESLSTWFAAFSMTCIMVVLLIAVALLLRRNRDENRNGPFYDIVLSGLFLLIPTLTTLFLYVFAMNMRKVAMYRGYLSFLEEQWNALVGAETMLFDEEIVREFFSFHSFLVNGLGPAVMSAFIVLAFVIGFGMSVHFLRKIESAKARIRMAVLLSVLLVICVSFSVMCAYYLSINDSVMMQVIKYCQEVNS